MNTNFVRNEKIIFPWFTPEELDKADDKFNAAYALHMMPRSNEDIVAAVHGYGEAFEEGNSQAAANLLNIICKTISNRMAACPGEPRVFQEKLWYYISELHKRGEDEIAKYYLAIVTIYGLLDTDDEEESARIGWEEMEELASLNNSWAIAFLNYVEMN